MFEIIRNVFKSSRVREEEACRALFDARNNHDMARMERMQKDNTEMRAMLSKSNSLLKGEIDVNKLLPPSSQTK